MGVCIGMAGCPTCGGSPAAVARCKASVARAEPINNAARRARGLPEDPNEPKGAGYEDYIVNEMLKRMGVQP